MGFLSQVIDAVGPEPASTTEIWLRWSIQLATVIGGLVSLWLTLRGQLRATDSKVEAVREEAAKAAEYSAPTGNGYAAKTLRQQEEMLGMLKEMSERVENTQNTLIRHLESHISNK